MTVSHLAPTTTVYVISTDEIRKGHKTVGIFILSSDFDGHASFQQLIHYKTWHHNQHQRLSTVFVGINTVDYCT